MSEVRRPKMEEKALPANENKYQNPSDSRTSLPYGTGAVPKFFGGR